MHVLATDGAFRADGSFVALPPVPEAALEVGFQQAVLAFLAESGAIPQALREKLFGWEHSGFSVQPGAQLVARRRHPPHLPPASRHRVVRREGEALALAPSLAA